MPPTRQSTALLPLAPAVFHLLLALAEGDAHGYRLRASVIERSNGVLKLDPGSLYRLIARLSEDGLIDEAPTRPSAALDDDRRRYYRLTKLGRDVLMAETDRMAELVRISRAQSAKRARHV